MTATNHALTGAVLGLVVSNPLLALPIAFLSHFALDAVPHYDPPVGTSHRRFTLQLVLEALLCGLVVLWLALVQPNHWIAAAFCAFLATSPDLMWLPKYLQGKEMDQVRSTDNVLWRFHAWVQWKTSPRLLAVEVVWCLTSAFTLLVII